MSWSTNKGNANPTDDYDRSEASRNKPDPCHASDTKNITRNFESSLECELAHRHCSSSPVHILAAKIGRFQGKDLAIRELCEMCHELAVSCLPDKVPLPLDG